MKKKHNSVRIELEANIRLNSNFLLFYPYFFILLFLSFNFFIFFFFVSDRVPPLGGRDFVLPLAKGLKIILAKTEESSKKYIPPLLYLCIGIYHRVPGS